MDFNCILVRYGEIALKGGNRGFFENTLVSNIRRAFKADVVKFAGVERISGRFLVESSDEKALGALSKVFGISSYSPAVKVKNDLDDVKPVALKLLKEYSGSSFRVTARRLDKTVSGTSPELNEKIGAYLVKETGLPVKLKGANIDIGIDFTKTSAFVFAETFEGLGGLPVGVSGKVVCLLSGGIDSPVAGYLMMKRGCSVTFVHFMHQARVPEKILTLHKILSGFQPGLKLILVPSAEMERELIKNVPAKYRIVILRRMFMRVAEKIMKDEKAKAIATGDNIAQVASQTLENMAVAQECISSLVLRPLACFDKQEIINMAEKIGTYKISVEEYVDCCSFLLAKHPETRAKIEEVKKMEETFDFSVLENIMDNALVMSAEGRKDE